VSRQATAIKQEALALVNLKRGKGSPLLLAYAVGCAPEPHRKSQNVGRKSFKNKVKRLKIITSLLGAGQRIR